MNVDVSNVPVHEEEALEFVNKVLRGDPTVAKFIESFDEDRSFANAMDWNSSQGQDDRCRLLAFLAYKIRKVQELEKQSVGELNNNSRLQYASRSDGSTGISR